MLRFLGERRTWVALLSLLVVLSIVLWFYAREQAANRATRAIEQRLGLEAKIGDTTIGLRGATMRDVELRGSGGGLTIRVDEVVADLNPVAVLWAGTRAIREVAANGVTVEVDLSDPGAQSSIVEVREALGARGSGPTTHDTKSAVGRSYSLTGLNLRVRDAHGPLLSVTDGAFAKEQRGLRASVRESTMGGAPGDHARIGPVEVVLSRADGPWRIRTLAVESGTVDWRGGAEGDGKPLPTRLREAVGLLMGPGSEPDPSSGLAATTRQGDRSPRFLSRLSPDVELRVSKFDITSRMPGGREERIRDLEAALTGEGDGWLQLAASGETSNGGTLEADVRLHPGDARADGSLRARGLSLALIAPFVPAVPLYQPEAGTVSAQVDLSAESSDRILVGGEVRLSGAALYAEQIAAEPIEDITFAAAGEGVWFPSERRLELPKGQLRMGRVNLLLEGEFVRNAEYSRIDLTAKLPPTPCNDVVGAIPRDLTRSLRGFSWSGTWGGVAEVSIDSRDLQATVLQIRVRDLCEFERVPRWARVERFQEPFRHRVVEPDETTFQMIAGPGSASWVPLEEMSPFLIQSVLSHEDAGFYDHGGFAPWAIRDALVRNLEEGRYVVGASTISMQLAKNLYLQRDKTIARKVREVILTWWLEHALEKDQLLELYLNVIEYGPSVYGLRQGAMHYFGRLPSELSPAESAFLASILPSPKRYHEYYKRDALTPSIQGKMQRLLEHMAKRGRIGPDALAFGLSEIQAFDFRQDGEPAPPPRTLPPLGVELEDEEPGLDPFEALFVAP